MRINAYRTTTETVDEEFATVTEFRAKYPDFQIESVDDKEVIAICEACRVLIFDGEAHYPCGEDGDEGDLCEICYAQATDNFEHRIDA